jgi:hypothetical protein
VLEEERDIVGNAGISKFDDPRWINRASAGTRLSPYDDPMNPITLILESGPMRGSSDRDVI